MKPNQHVTPETGKLLAEAGLMIPGKLYDLQETLNLFPENIRPRGDINPQWTEAFCYRESEYFRMESVQVGNPADAAGRLLLQLHRDGKLDKKGVTNE